MYRALKFKAKLGQKFASPLKSSHSVQNNYIIENKGGSVQIQQFDLPNDHLYQLKPPMLGTGKKVKKTKSSSTREKELLLKLDEYIHVNQERANSILEKNNNLVR